MRAAQEAMQREDGKQRRARILPKGLPAQKDGAKQGGHSQDREAQAGIETTLRHILKNSSYPETNCKAHRQGQRPRPHKGAVATREVRSIKRHHDKPGGPSTTISKKNHNFSEQEPHSQRQSGPLKHRPTRSQAHITMEKDSKSATRLKFINANLDVKLAVLYAIAAV